MNSNYLMHRHVPLSSLLQTVNTLQVAEYAAQVVAWIVFYRLSERLCPQAGITH